MGARDPRCVDGPEALRGGGLVPRLHRAGLDADWIATLDTPSGSEPILAVRTVTAQLARRTQALVARYRLPVVIGGDHSCAIGTWKGIACALAARGPLGLVWIDAHMDAHTPATSPSGMLHGMPLACLLGHGHRHLTAIAGDTRLDPRHVCLVGVRSFESGEAALLKGLGVRVFYMVDVARLGLRAILDEALAIATNGTAGFGFSLDLDALDPRDAPGVGSAVPGGIRACELLPALSRIAGERALAGVEIVEYNPHRDRGGVTARRVGDVLESLLAPRPALRLIANRTGRTRRACNAVARSCRAPDERRIASIRSGADEPASRVRIRQTLNRK